MDLTTTNLFKSSWKFRVKVFLGSIRVSQKLFSFLCAFSSSITAYQSLNSSSSLETRQLPIKFSISFVRVFFKGCVLLKCFGLGQGHSVLNKFVILRILWGIEIGLACIFGIMPNIL